MFRRLLPMLTLVCASIAPAQKLAITFDDLPSHGKLPPGVTRVDVAKSILDTLKREHMPPTFGFVNGFRGENEPASMPVLQLWHDAGQPLANHTWAHKDINDLSAEEFLAAVDQNEATLKSFDRNRERMWLRYPYLHEGDTVEKRRAVRAGLFARGYRIAEVTMDFEDYLWNDPYARCFAKHDEAALQYLHDSYLSTAEQYIRVDREMSHRLFQRDVPYVLLMHIGAFDAKMLPELIALYRRNGFRFISMPDALKDPAYKADPDAGDAGGGTLTELLEQAKQLKPLPNHKPYKKLAELCR